MHSDHALHSKSDRLLVEPSDRRTLLWSLGLFPIPFVASIISPWASLWLLPFSLYLGFCAGVLSHYHNHRRVFRSRRLSQLYSLWLSIFYGVPLFAWIPTHNQNHHKYHNGELDRTSTLRMRTGDSLINSLLYPSLSSVWQLPSVFAYLHQLSRKDRVSYRVALAQILIIPLAHGAMIWALVDAHGRVGLWAYGAGVLIPAAFASWSMMFINYLQHIGCHPESKDNHSRNFVGRFENWLVFDAGLHTVHHEHPGVHWSRYRALHAARSARIDPALNERNVLWFLWRRYFSVNGRETTEPARLTPWMGL